MKKMFTSKAQTVISVIGLLLMTVVFIWWLKTDEAVNKAGTVAAILSVVLFVIVCLKFVKCWMELWQRKDQKESVFTEKCPKWKTIGVLFIQFLLYDCLILWIIHGIRVLVFQDTTSFREGLNFFLHIDTGYYLDIAEQWYVNSEQSIADLVFFPGYPVLIRLVNYLFRNTLISAVVVSGLFYAGSACALFQLLLQEYGEKTAFRGIKYLAILPATFFFAAPMSESLFLFLSILSYYEARNDRWLFACLLGFYCAFTRSMGVILFAPLVFMSITGILKEPACRKKWVFRLVLTLLVPLGTVVYLGINWDVTGSPLTFTEVEKEKWNQGLGWFFDATAFQIDNGLADLSQPYFTNALGLWLPNVAYSLAVLLLMALTAQKLRPEITLWFIGYYAVAIGATYLVSAPRYLVACFPVYPAIVTFTEEKKSDRIFTVLSVLTAIYYLFAFVARWEVY